MFKGETLRSMLLNAYGWWKVSQITYIAAIVAFALGGLVLLASLFGLTIGRHPEIVHEIIRRHPRHARMTPARTTSGPRPPTAPGRRIRPRYPQPDRRARMMFRPTVALRP